MTNDDGCWTMGAVIEPMDSITAPCKNEKGAALPRGLPLLSGFSKIRGFWVFPADVRRWAHTGRYFPRFVFAYEAFLLMEQKFEKSY